MNGIINLPLVPLRDNDSERSELCSQLLFGEQVEIIEERERWLFVRNITDNYYGWADRKMIQILNFEEEKQLTNVESNCVCLPLLECRNISSDETLFLPGGSKIFQSGTNELIFDGKTYLFDPMCLPSSTEISGFRLASLAKQYLYAPYLWGGKSIMGIDCSGLMQVVYSMCGIQLPRDASQQVDCGRVIDFLQEAQAGDLAFFENAESKIIHVGLLLNAFQIIHASGWVKIETIDSQGIISTQTGEYTHKLRVVKRLI